MLISSPASLAAQGQVDEEDYDSRRARALQYYQDDKFDLAVPQLKSLVKERPMDVEVLVALAFSLLTRSGAVEDPDKQREMMIEAREHLLKAKELGGAGEHALGVLEILPEDGITTPFSHDEVVERAMKEGEAAFSRKDWDEALAAYETAYLMDPKLYMAALFIGDVYFVKGKPASAGSWFARAIEIDPDRETAHRYWGDALLQERAPDEALEKYLSAIVAEPYNRLSWAGLIKWAKQEDVELAHPKIESPNQVSQEDEGKINIIIDSGSTERRDGSGSWFIYEIFRAARMTKDKDDSDDGEELSALEDEVMALTMVAGAVDRDMTEGKIDELDPGLATLLKLHKSGLLEAYVSISRADDDIRQDYPAYREENRDKLIRYIREYIIQPKAGEEEAAAGKD